MSEQDNIRTVQLAYERFTKGDIPALLQMLSQDVDWEGVVGAPENVPTRGRRRGVQQVGEFFQQVGDNLSFEEFEPRDYIAQGDRVVALGSYRGTARPTGRSFSGEWAMVFTLRGGRIAHFREYVATSSLADAFDRSASAGGR